MKILFQAMMMMMMAARGRRRLCCKFFCGVSLAQNQYTYSQVTKITNNFSKVLGKGAFGVVYRGVMKDQQQVVVKMLNRASIYDIEQFTAEVTLDTRKRILSFA